MNGPGSENNVDQEAFVRLVMATHEIFMAFILRQIASTEVGQEVLQEVYLEAYQGLKESKEFKEHRDLKEFEGNPELTTWLYTKMQRKIFTRLLGINHENDRNHFELVENMRNSLPIESGSKDNQMISPSGIATPERVLARNAIEKLIGLAIEHLPEALRITYQLSDLEGLPVETVSEILGISSDKINYQRHEARQKIVSWVQDKMAKAPVSK